MSRQGIQRHSAQSRLELLPSNGGTTTTRFHEIGNDLLYILEWEIISSVNRCGCTPNNKLHFASIRFHLRWTNCHHVRWISVAGSVLNTTNVNAQSYGQSDTIVAPKLTHERWPRVAQFIQ